MEKYMIKLVFALPMTLVLLSGCASAPPQNLQTDDSRACAQNFTYDGSFLAGRTFKTHQFVDGVSKDIAMVRAAKHLALEGYSITNTDKEMGLISASQTVSFGQGKTVPLNVSIDSKDKGVNVSISFSISGGLTTPVNSVKDGFCDIIKAIQGS
jgi:ABC-type Fe3+-hydroxamate transport system substrate-binding protein